MFKTLLALSLVSALGASSLQFKISYKPRGGKLIGNMLDRTILTIISLNDEKVLIKKVIPNRGDSCKIMHKVGDDFKEKFKKEPLFHHTLKYGQKIVYSLKCDPSQVLEMEIVTDKGTYTKKFTN
ncbi:hypothetical protein [Helicobacter ailurogastricus]|uniref:Uncharacterized protein n=1 Tax=Helicobacter ailurogastricus TaxID=1578720 RepID=A0A0K2X3B5_9HELI|nr:hypothetical protein [Helicobacter ailurogastricus]CRF40627.1 hypothetical protein HAL011_03890 [Helicobacter ailurogastricus]CRF42281.1 hypothetical protein HAL013_04480 [Helicobacter ailurogastricus]CRF44233.1 hypothetical protein HAL09_08080 [Helicobacter ailurogastricus]CRI32345.1 hypothetical protein HAL07_08200 [Helicobacter ailurogastricus]BDQ28819.1 hypothetical protein ASB7_06560 [Helicobacter ailurogastricus]